MESFLSAVAFGTAVALGAALASAGALGAAVASAGALGAALASAFEAAFATDLGVAFASALGVAFASALAFLAGGFGLGTAVQVTETHLHLRSLQNNCSDKLHCLPHYNHDYLKVPKASLHSWLAAECVTICLQAAPFW